MASVTSISTVGAVDTYHIPVSTSLKSAIEDLCQNSQLTTWMMDPRSYESEIMDIRRRSQEILMKFLPDALLNDLQHFTIRPIPQMLIIKQLPFEGPEESELAECFLLGISGVMSMKPFTYKSEHSGRLLHHITPDEKHEYSQMGISSRATLSLHVENSFDPHRPDNMALYCLTGDSMAKTTFYSLEKLYSKIDQNLHDQLESVGRKNEFLFQAPQSFIAGKANHGALIFDLANGVKAIRFDTPLYLHGLTKEAQTLTEQLQHFLDTDEGRPDGYCLQRGEMLIWSNHTNMHGRTAYTPNYMPNNKRFLVRMFMTTDHALSLARD